MSTARAPQRRRPSPRPTPRTSANRSRDIDGAALALRPEERARPTTRRRPNLEVVTPNRAPRRVRRLRLLGALAGLLLFGSLLGLAVFHSVLVQGQLGLDRLDEQIQQEQDLQRELRREVAMLASPERIIAEAQARGMVAPDRREYLVAVVPGQVVPPPGAHQ